MHIFKISLLFFLITFISLKSTFAVEERTLTSHDNEKVLAKNIEKHDVSDSRVYENKVKKSFKLKRFQKKIIRKFFKYEPDPVDDEVLLVILAILLPPLAVYFVEGIGDYFWIDLILTILGWIPGMIFALYIVLR